MDFSLLTLYGLLFINITSLNFRYFLFVFFLCLYSFILTLRKAQVFGKTLVSEFHYFFSHT